MSGDTNVTFVKKDLLQKDTMNYTGKYTSKNERNSIDDDISFLCFIFTKVNVLSSTTKNSKMTMNNSEHKIKYFDLHILSR